MKERPILFSSDMVKAILCGRKTQTRRVIKLQPDSHLDILIVQCGETDRWECRCRTPPQTCVGKHGGIKCPYGIVGDKLWVRETHYFDPGDQVPEVFYRTDYDEKDAYEAFTAVGNKWRPSRFMPKWATRIWLEITNVRAEKVQEITEADCLAEGIRGYEAHGGGTHFNPVTLYPAFPEKGGGFCTAKEAFELLWDSLNAKRGYSWESNPWVWVIEFKKLKPNF